MAIDLLKQLFAGYVYGYGGLRIHSKDSYTNITHLECEHFRNLGRALGYIGNREYSRMDLVWQEPIDTTTGVPDKIVLYMERETNCSRFFTDALKKLQEWDRANSNMGAILVGLGGWITKDHLQGSGKGTLEGQIKDFYDNTGSSKNDVLLITWIGPKKDKAELVMATAISRNTHTVEYAYARPKLLPSSYWDLYPIDKDGKDSMTLDWLQPNKPIWDACPGEKGSNWDNLYQQL